MWPFKNKPEEEPVSEEKFYYVSVLLQTGNWLSFSTPKSELQHYLHKLEGKSGGLTCMSKIPTYRTYPHKYYEGFIEISNISDVIAIDVKEIVKTCPMPMMPG